jgi:hypothetical protein
VAGAANYRGGNGGNQGGVNTLLTSQEIIDPTSSLHSSTGWFILANVHEGVWEVEDDAAKDDSLPGRRDLHQQEKGKTRTRRA